MSMARGYLNRTRILIGPPFPHDNLPGGKSLNAPVESGSRYASLILRSFLDDDRGG